MLITELSYSVLFFLCNIKLSSLYKSKYFLLGLDSTLKSALVLLYFTMNVSNSFINLI